MYKKYAFTTASSLILCIALTLSVTLTTDPYKLYPQLSRLDSGSSPDLFYHLRLHKPYAVTRIRPNHLIVGSSRSARLPPAEFERLGGIAYNASLPGTTLQESQRVIEHAHASGDLQTVILGLDYMFFTQKRGWNPHEPTEARWLPSPTNRIDRLVYLYQRFEDFLRSQLSVDSLMDSWRILAGTGAEKPSQRAYIPDGTWHFTRLGLTADILYAILAKQVFNDLQNHKTDRAVTLDALTEMLDFAADNGIRLLLFISPRQALQMQTLYHAGEWENYLRWHRDLVTLVDAHDARVSLYGIEDNAELVLEPVDAAEPLFRDGLHYRRKAGHSIMACLLGPCSSTFQPTKLDAQSIDMYLARLDMLRRQYLAAHPRDAERLVHWLQPPTGAD
ncbi:MAG: hypothetical protein HRT77_10400 [Halioglobus sp.]|nr:hypothetical protein [Halioglobus sp.]